MQNIVLGEDKEEESKGGRQGGREAGRDLQQEVEGSQCRSWWTCVYAPPAALPTPDKAAALRRYCSCSCVCVRVRCVCACVKTPAYTPSRNPTDIPISNQSADIRPNVTDPCSNLKRWSSCSGFHSIVSWSLPKSSCSSSPQNSRRDPIGNTRLKTPNRWTHTHIHRQSVCAL